jgi:uncharacterized protein YfdQ (DUF2303 family)
MSTEAEAIAALAAKSGGASIVTLPDARVYLVTPEGFTAEDVTDPHGLTPGVPARIAARATLQTVDSLVDYVSHYANPTGGRTVLFADIAKNRIAGLIDYHTAAQAANVDHAAIMDLPFSEEWKVWTAAHGKMVGQLEFARFVEENAADVEAPSGGELLDVVRDLHAVRKVDFKKAVRTSSDNESFEYVDETTANTRNGAVEIPSKFKLRLPVYFGGRTVELFAFLRWHLDDGNLKLGVALHRAEHVRQAEFKLIVEDAASRTGCPAVFGFAGG